MTDFPVFESLEDFFASAAAPAPLLAESAVNKLNRYASGSVGYKCGINGLNPYLQLMPSELAVIAARSGVGKTALGMQVVYSVLEQVTAKGEDAAVVVFSAEMDSDALLLREACARTGVSYSSLAAGASEEQLSDEDYERVRSALYEAADKRLWIDQSSSPTVEHMAAQLEHISADKTLALVLFDYTELSGEWDKSETLRIAKISRGLKALSQKYDCPVLALSQVSREIERRSDKRPNMSDLMHGGEREPDRIVIMTRADEESTLGPDVRLAYVVKNRHGEAPWHPIAMRFDGARMWFETVKLISEELESPGEPAPALTEIPFD